MKNLHSLILVLALAACEGGSGNAGVTPPSYTLRQVAVGQTRVIVEEDLSIEMVSASDSRCPESVQCIQAGQAEVNLVVRKQEPLLQPLTLTLSPGRAVNDQPTFAGFQFILDDLLPHPTTTGPLPQDRRADITIRRL